MSILYLLTGNKFFFFLNSHYAGTGATWRINTKILSTCTGRRHIVSPRAQLVIATGLRRKHVFPASVARPATDVQPGAHQQVRGATSLRQLGAAVDPRHLLPQREEGRFPQGHRQKPAVKAERHRTPVVRHQVCIVRGHPNKSPHSV